MDSPTVCPNCHHTRAPDSTAPPDICPKCNTPYARWHIEPPPPRSYKSMTAFLNASPTLDAAQTLLTVALVVFGLVGALAWSQQGTGIMPEDVVPDVRKDPRQGKTDAPTFTFTYRNAVYEVDPVHSYTIAGLVVSHNDITSFWDSYHDADSVDTKDLCVIWGGNTLVDTFNLVNFSSGSWTCYASWGQGVSMNMNELSNNHLITDNDAIRDLIGHVRVGDQVWIQGKLVNYRTAGTANWRSSSVTREDTGNHACEVVFVEDMRILARGTPWLYGLATLCQWMVVLVLLAKLVVFGVQVKQG